MSNHIDQELRRVGLDPAENAYPRVIVEGDQIWLRCTIDGKEIDCEISVRRGFVLAGELIVALARVVPR